MPPLIAFDLDGTLVDSRLDLAESANELLASYGALPLPVDAIVAMVGEGAKVLVGRVLQAAGVAGRDDALRRFLEIYDRRLTANTELYPHVLEALEGLRGRARIAMLTNKPEHHTGKLLEALGIGQHFQEVIGGDSALGRKPDPAGLRQLMATAGASPDATLMVGDSPVDAETARRAGAHMCVCLYGFGGITADAGTDGRTLVVRESGELAGVLDRFLSGRVEVSRAL